MSNENDDLVCVVCVLQRDDVLVSLIFRHAATSGNPNACCPPSRRTRGSILDAEETRNF